MYCKHCRNSVLRVLFNHRKQQYERSGFCTKKSLLLIYNIIVYVSEKDYWLSLCMLNFLPRYVWYDMWNIQFQNLVRYIICPSFYVAYGTYVCEEFLLWTDPVIKFEIREEEQERKVCVWNICGLLVCMCVLLKIYTNQNWNFFYDKECIISSMLLGSLQYIKKVLKINICVVCMLFLLLFCCCWFL